MIDFKKYMPSAINEPFIARTKYGIRVIEKSNNPFAPWIFVDCTHPLQNCHCNPYHIYEWEYIDDKKMQQLLFEKNWMAKLELQRQADEIINKISDI